MRMTNLISASLMSAALCAGVAEASLTQGGWRQWEVRLRWRDGATTVGRITLAHVRWSEGSSYSAATRSTCVTSRTLSSRHRTPRAPPASASGELAPA